jgi:hypothetical protein
MLIIVCQQIVVAEEDLSPSAASWMKWEPKLVSEECLPSIFAMTVQTSIR